MHYVFDDLEYILNLVGNNPNTTVPQEIWNTGMGDRTDYKKYKCWKWSSYRYVQSKPWRTFNVNTGWDPTDINYNENYKFRVVEYDYPFYDRGVDYWCELLGITVQGASGANIVGIIIGYLSYLTCDILIINDDPVGDRTNFESIVQTAANNEGTVYQWDLPNRWKIKLKVQ